jgi:S-(hydroxymethyl)glutathione dehydrogenase/alcohol dehydrogenase
LFRAGWPTGPSGSVFAAAGEAQEAIVELTRGQLADHAIITVGVLSSEVVDQAAAIIGKGSQVTVTSVGLTRSTRATRT